MHVFWPELQKDLLVIQPLIKNNFFSSHNFFLDWEQNSEWNSDVVCSVNEILTETFPFESHTYKHQCNSVGFFKITPHTTYETAHTGIKWVCIGQGSILWGFICVVYYILFSWLCHAAVCSVSLQKLVSSLGVERFWDLITAPQQCFAGWFH